MRHKKTLHRSLRCKPTGTALMIVPQPEIDNPGLTNWDKFYLTYCAGYFITILVLVFVVGAPVK